jgi:hypothetical protein
MIRMTIRSLVLIGLGLSVTACARHNPAQANCFNFSDAPARTASVRTTTISTMGAEVSRGNTACDFVMLGAGG